MTSSVDKFIAGTKSSNYSLTQVDSYLLLTSKESGIVTIALNELSKKDAAKVASAIESLKHRILYLVKGTENVPDTYDSYYDSFITKSYNKKKDSSTLRISLENWINRAKGTPEHIARINAAKKICEAFIYDHAYLDLSSFNLSNLPEGLCSLKALKYISTQQIDLNNQSETFKSFFNNLKTQGFEEEFAKTHPEQFALIYSESTKKPLQLDEASRALSQKLGSIELFSEALPQSTSSTDIVRENQQTAGLDHELSLQVSARPHPRQTQINTASRAAQIASTFFSYLIDHPILFLFQTVEYTHYHIQKFCSQILRYAVLRDANTHHLSPPTIDNPENLTDLCKACSHTSSYSEYEGWKVAKSHMLVAKALDNTPDSAIPMHIKDQLKQAFQESSKGNFNQDTVDKIKTGQLVILPLGYDSIGGGHSICLVFYQGKMMICNRGSRNLNKEASFVYFQINPNKMNLTLLKNLEKLNRFMASSTSSGMTHQSLVCYNALPLALEATSIEVPEGLHGKDQQYGTCSLSSAKKAVFGALFMMQSDKENAPAIAKTQKRAFSTVLRSQAIDALYAYSQTKTLGDKEKKLLKHAQTKLSSYKERKTSATSE